MKCFKFLIFFSIPAGYKKTGRGYPDLSALGHHLPSIIGTRNVLVDGTSASAPIIAGMFALINNERLLNGQAPMGFLNPFIYQSASTNAASITDITVGYNRCPARRDASTNPVCCNYGFKASMGWDPLTGLGSPNFPIMKQLALRKTKIKFNEVQNEVKEK